MKIYTKTGDSGETSLFDGTRVARPTRASSPTATSTKLQACLGVVRAAGLPTDLDEMCVTLQRDLFALGARLADPSHKIAARVTKIVVDDESVARLEAWIDALDAETAAAAPLHPVGRQPGAGASLHLARTVCRRAERAVLSLGADAVEPVVLVYLNRLSDLLFVMARAANHRAGVTETEW